MSNTEFTLEAKARNDKGKGASRRLRRLANEVPAIIYGAGKEPTAISLVHDDLMHASDNEAFFTHILEINVEGSKESVIIKDMQRHPAKPVIMHADFQRVKADQELHVNIPLHFINEDTCVGVKQDGGQISHLLNELEIHCLPKNLPEYIEVDVANLHLGDSIHIADLTLPEGVSSVALSHGEEGNHGVVQVIKVKTQDDSGSDDAAEDGESSDSED
jgi:large subunit ribosomal protein L25